MTLCRLRRSNSAHPRAPRKASPITAPTAATDVVLLLEAGIAVGDDVTVIVATAGLDVPGVVTPEVESTVRLVLKGYDSRGR